MSLEWLLTLLERIFYSCLNVIGWIIIETKLVLDVLIGSWLISSLRCILDHLNIIGNTAWYCLLVVRLRRKLNLILRVELKLFSFNFSFWNSLHLILVKAKDRSLGIMISLSRFRIFSFFSNRSLLSLHFFFWNVSHERILVFIIWD